MTCAFKNTPIFYLVYNMLVLVANLHRGVGIFREESSYMFFGGFVIW